MKRRSIIPIHNLNKVPFDLPFLTLSKSTIIAPVDGGDYSALHFGAEEIYRPIVNTSTICVLVDDPPEHDFSFFARLTAMKVCFVLNSCAEASPLIMSKCALLRKEPDTKYLETVDISGFHKASVLSSPPFILMASISPAEIEKLYDIYSSVLEDHPETHVTIDRYNCSLYRVEPNDQIIDITTSLESLIRSQTEIAFKFALYIAFIIECDPIKRQGLFETLQGLYAVRSAIVHGDIHSANKKKQIKAIAERMDEIRRIAHQAISYYIFYLSDKHEVDWQKYLEQLVLGKAKRIEL